MTSLVVVLVLAAGGLFLYARFRFDQLHKTTVAGLTPRQGNDPFDVLLVGSDSRAFVDTPSEVAKFGSPSEETGQRSDVIIVARVAPLTHQVELLSIPRDTWVDIPGQVPGISGPNRINAAFDRGPNLLVSTIEKTFQLPITYYAEVNFPGFSGMVDALGGIGLDFADPVRDAYSGLDITRTGCQLVNGTQALALVRSRHLYYYAQGTWNYDGNSDFSRIQRQDAFFRAVIAKLHGAVSNPIALNDFVGAATHDVTIDQTLSEGALVSLADLFRGVSTSGLSTETLPTSEAVIGGADVLVPAPGPDEQMLDAFLAFGTAGPKATATTAFVRGGLPGGTPAGAELTSALVAGEHAGEQLDAQAATKPGSVTVTTVPGAPAGGAVVYNNHPEPWNPTPCSP